jgi:hypothetical protein
MHKNLLTKLPSANPKPLAQVAEALGRKLPNV